MVYLIQKKKNKKGIPLSREERILAWIIAVCTLGFLVIEALIYFQITSSDLALYLSNIAYSVLFVLVLLVVSIIVVGVIRRRAGIEQWMARRYLGKLKHKIREELENVATTKNLDFPHQLRSHVLSQLATQVSRDIVNTPAPKVYLVQLMLDKNGDVYLAGLYLTIPMESAQVLADKITELSKDMRYRKRYRLLLLP